MPGARDFTAVRVVTFDAAGTLVRPHPSVGAVYRRIARQHGREYPAATLDAEFRRAFSAVSNERIRGGGEAREVEFWRRVVQATIAAGGPAPDDFEAYFAELWEAFAHAECWRLLPHAAETLAELHARGYRLGVISNWDRRLHRVLAEIGLSQWLSHVIISSEAGAEKPQTGIFRAAETAFGAAPAQCLHVGDSVEHDLNGARSAGWAALIVHHRETAGAPHEIGQLRELLALLAAPGAE